MPRLREIPRDEVTAPVVTMMYDFLFGERDPVAEPGTTTGTPGDWWTVFANSPDIFEHAVQGFGIYRSSRRQLDPVLRELGQTRAGWAVGSQFVFSQHCKSCRLLGMSESKIQAIAYWQASDEFTPVERLVLAYTDALAVSGGRMHDQLFAALREHLSDLEILELTYITSLYVMHAIMSKALRTEWDNRDDPIVELEGPEGFQGYDVGAAISGGAAE
ncbi:MAG TPA: carboxymuconolactone decarboxylase family protein [Microthrixaceae bacterium]|jgi:alkylhydroperoxidase family enzyme|nr:carboxymuconolactone decarboxylase family protein [Microthrixaceae bacterium]